MENELNKLMLETQREYTKSNRTKDKIIILLIVLMFLEAVIGYSGFVWYESQFDYVDSQDVTLETEGDNANAEYNVIKGNQYNGNAVHNQGGDE